MAAETGNAYIFGLGTSLCRIEIPSFQNSNDKSQFSTTASSKKLSPGYYDNNRWGNGNMAAITGNTYLSHKIA